jgi:hypothetical protein
MVNNNELERSGRGLIEAYPGTFLEELKETAKSLKQDNRCTDRDWNQTSPGHNSRVRFEVFTPVTMKNAVYWDVAPCRSCVNRRFGGMYRLHLQGIKISERGISVSRRLKMEAIRSSETSVHTRSTRQHIPEDGILHNSRALPPDHPLTL